MFVVRWLQQKAAWAYTLHTAHTGYNAQELITNETN